MATEPSAGTSPPSRDDEVSELRRRIAELERELAEHSARANAAVAAAEDRSYWLDRMRIDMNAVMRNPVARAAFSVALLAARVWRALRWRLR
jgi:cell division septum initiation protein DivIVA